MHNKVRPNRQRQRTKNTRPLQVLYRYIYNIETDFRFIQYRCGPIIIYRNTFFSPSSPCTCPFSCCSTDGNRIKFTNKETELRSHSQSARLLSRDGFRIVLTLTHTHAHISYINVFDPDV